jgi:hypothetical protein
MTGTTPEPSVKNVNPAIAGHSRGKSNPLKAGVGTSIYQSNESHMHR